MKVGSLVECVKTPREPFINVIYPVKGKIYTVRGFHISGNSVYVQEIDNSSESCRTPSGSEPGFVFPFFVEVLPPMEISVESLIHQNA